jgi:hypothetical protein
MMKRREVITSMMNSRRPMSDMGLPSRITAGSACHRTSQQVHGEGLNRSESSHCP